MKSTVLVYPPVILGGRYKTLATGTEVPPQPLLYLGAVLRDRCSLLDANALHLSVEETVEEILKRNPKYVGISSPTMLIKTTAEICKEIKVRRPDIVTIVGGPHITALPEETMNNFLHIDIGVIGEGERTIVELVDALDSGKSLKGVNGLIWKYHRTPPREYIEDLDTLPYPAWYMLDLSKYQQIAARVDRLPCMSIITSRGCPFQCTFCCRTVFKNRVRTHSAKYLYDMLLYLKFMYKLRSVSFEDENFVADKKRLYEFCDMKPTGLTWDCCSHVNSITEETVSKMKQAGCWQINFGIESGNQEILNRIKKNTTLERIEKALAICRKHGIITKGYFIIGHPGETLETIQDTISFAKRIPLDIFQQSHMCPFPGTELWDTADQYGEFDRDYTKSNIWSPQFIPKGLTKEILESESKRAYREFYFRPRPILQFLMRALRPSCFVKFVKDGIKILKFLLQGYEVAVIAVISAIITVLVLLTPVTYEHPKAIYELNEDARIALLSCDYRTWQNRGDKWR